MCGIAIRVKGIHGTNIWSFMACAYLFGVAFIKQGKEHCQRPRSDILPERVPNPRHNSC